MGCVLWVICCGDFDTRHLWIWNGLDGTWRITYVEIEILSLDAQILAPNKHGMRAVALAVIRKTGGCSMVCSLPGSLPGLGLLKRCDLGRLTIASPDRLAWQQLTALGVGTVDQQQPNRMMTIAAVLRVAGSMMQRWAATATVVVVVVVDDDDDKGCSCSCSCSCSYLW